MTQSEINMYQFKFWHLYFVITGLYLVMTYAMNSFVFTNDYYYSILSDKMDTNRISEVLRMQHKYQFIGYLAFPVILLLKLWVLGGVVFTGFYLLNKDIKYKDCLKIVLLAELVAVVAMLVKIAWLIIYKPANANDIQYFSPLSLAQLVNFNNEPKYLFYPLQLFNVFEVAYWLVLAYGVMAFTNWKLEKSLKVVASCYGVALAVWAVVVVFIQVQFS